MGVPVVTLPGPTFAGRHSASHLVNAGMPELVANDWEQYINITVGIANDLGSLSVIRQHLRDILLSSPVCDGKRFAKHFSDAMRAIWQRYCEGKEPEALTLSNDFAPYFHDDNQPVTLQHPVDAIALGNNKVSDGFSFQLPGKVITIDNGGGVATGSNFINLTATDAFHFVIMDIIGAVEEKHLPLRKKSIQHIKLHGLGDGNPTPVYMCLAPEYSSDLKPLATNGELQEKAPGKQVLAEVVAQTSKLDHIHGLDHLDWLILDNRYDIRKAIAHGEHILSGCLAVQVRITFTLTHQDQLLFGDVTALLAKYGFVFHTLKNIEYAQPVTIDEQKTLPSSKMISAIAVYVPDDARLKSFSPDQREKLAFILHTVYGIHDLAYFVLAIDSKERATHYIDDNKYIEPGDASKAKKKIVKAPLSLIPDMPRMSDEETQLFERCLKKTKSYFEFGSGGSTKLAARCNIEIFGVESDKFWVETLRNEVGPLCKVEFADIGPTKEWGYPVDNSNKENFPRYSESILKYDNSFDLILVDGRFRVACTLNAIKHSLQKQKNIADTSIFIHDFWCRPDYHAVLAFLETEDTAETAGVFKIKKNINMSSLEEMLEKYKYIPQ